MIFEKLTLQNFGLFRGKQVLDLHPLPGNGHSTPIVLFGGMNGGGKTTILDAVKLALYGPRGSYSKKANIAYDEFLRDSINRGVPASTGAAVALDFRITRDGEEHVYQVHRAWQQRGRTLRERVCVCKDGVQDQYAADHWTDLVEEVIPLGVSQLFFFDAEQIRFLADEETAQVSLGSAIKSLLGLDLAERLITDAGVLEGRFTQADGGRGRGSGGGGVEGGAGCQGERVAAGEGGPRGPDGPLGAGQERQREVRRAPSRPSAASTGRSGRPAASRWRTSRAGGAAWNRNSHSLPRGAAPGHGPGTAGLRP